MTGHQEHFLSRLDRVSLPHIELALRLYNDPDLVQFLLDHAELPAEAARVAISLEDARLGPFLIVTRRGDFVTCLGPGMRCDRLPVLPRERLDELLARAARAKARLERARRVAGSGLRIAPIVRRVARAGAQLSREDLVAALAVQPLLGTESLRNAIAELLTSAELRVRLARMLPRHPKARLTELLGAFWDGVYQACHHTLLSAETAAEVLTADPGLCGAPRYLTQHLMSYRVPALALRGAWYAAAVGEICLDAYLRDMSETDDAGKLLDAGLCAAAIALRHPGARERVCAAMSEACAHTDGGPLGSLMVAIATGTSRLLDGHATSLETYRARGASACVEAARWLPHGSPNRFHRAADVPEDLALAIAIDDLGAIDFTPEHATLLLELLPWATGGSAERLYLPADLLAARPRAWTARQTMRLLGITTEAERVPQRAGPSRQGPCPCGSGKKYKRCCETERKAA